VPGLLDVRFNLDPLEHSDLPVSLAMSVKCGEQSEATGTVVDEMAQLIRHWFAPLHAAAAFVSNREGGYVGSTRHESHSDRRMLVTWEAVNHYARGTTWSMGLGPTLCNRLEGAESVLANAPVPIKGRLGDGVWLQCSGNPADDYESVLAALEAYLYPLLDWTRDDPIVQWPKPYAPPSDSTPRRGRSTSPSPVAGVVTPVPVEYLPDVGLDTGLNLYLREPLDETRLAALTELVGDWYGRGLFGGFGGVGFHELRGPIVDGSILRWRIDFGSADILVALETLARELGATELGMQRLVIGVEHVG
jgi:hypothetical protein